MEKCDTVVMAFLAATEVGKWLPKRVEESELAVSPSGVFHIISFLWCLIDRFLLDACLVSFVNKGRGVAGVELRHLSGLPGGGGDYGAVIL
jgi:hypothetical protein